MTSQSGLSPLSLSIIRDMPEVTELLLNRGASITAQLLYDAAFTGRNLCLQVLMQYAPSLDLADEVNGTALMGAARSGHMDTAQLLIEAGASVNFETSHTALHIAIIFAQTDMVRMLLECGADPELKNWQGRNALDVARFDPGGSPRPKEFHPKIEILEACTSHPPIGTAPKTNAQIESREAI